MAKGGDGVNERPYYVGGYRFEVELDGMLVASFSEVSGLSMETEVEEVAEGGLNQFVHRLPARTKQGLILLKRGMTLSDELWQWYRGVVEGKFTRKSGSIILFDELGEEYRRWNFMDAYPTKWSGPELNALSSEVAIEQLELAHNGFKMI